MNSLVAYPKTPTPATVQYFFWSYPEWWSIALCWFAWAVMLLQGGQYAEHGNRHRLSFEQELSYWMVMAAAMMLPLTLDAVRVFSDPYAVRLLGDAATESTESPSEQAVLGRAGLRAFYYAISQAKCTQCAACARIQSGY